MANLAMQNVGNKFFFRSMNMKSNFVVPIVCSNIARHYRDSMHYERVNCVHELDVGINLSTVILISFFHPWHTWHPRWIFIVGSTESSLYFYCLHLFFEWSSQNWWLLFFPHNQQQTANQIVNNMKCEIKSKHAKTHSRLKILKRNRKFLCKGIIHVSEANWMLAFVIQSTNFYVH